MSFNSLLCRTYAQETSPETETQDTADSSATPGSTMKLYTAKDIDSSSNVSLSVGSGRKYERTDANHVLNSDVVESKTNISYSVSNKDRLEGDTSHLSSLKDLTSDDPSSLVVGGKGNTEQTSRETDPNTFGTSYSVHKYTSEENAHNDKDRPMGVPYSIQTQFQKEALRKNRVVK